MKIAIFDYALKPNRPGGNCSYQIVRALCREHEFTIFSLDCENPCPERIRWLPLRIPRRPPVLSQLAYYVAGPLKYRQHCHREGRAFDLVQIGTSNLWKGDVTYCHFCHRSYLRKQWREGHPAGMRGLAKLLEHLLYSIVEPVVFRRVRKIVVLSPEFARELADEYPFTKQKIQVIPNPIDVARMKRPDDFARSRYRANMGFGEDDVVLVFCALGHFERKGLPLLLRAGPNVEDRRLRLLIVGGEPARVSEYSAYAKRFGIGDRTAFVGIQEDLRPYLWSADAFVLPSAYEVRPMVSLEAAASGLPLLMSRFHGSGDLLEDGVSGIEVDRTVDGIAKAVRRFLELPVAERKQMGECARQRVLPYSIDNFVAAWRDLYREMDVA